MLKKTLLEGKLFKEETPIFIYTLLFNRVNAL
jgi:hypothetical protein